jgi:hypothetical protein
MAKISEMRRRSHQILILREEVRNEFKITPK